MIFTKKLFAFDLDGTLVEHKTKTIPSSALQTIDNLRKKGHIVGIATGRNLSQVTSVIDTSLLDFVILGNGGYLQIDNEEVHSVSFSKEEIQHITSSLEENNIPFWCTNYKELVSLYPVTRNCIKLLETFSFKEPVRVKRLDNHKLLQFTIYDSHETIKRIPEINNLYDIQPIYDWGYDIVKKDINKGEMLQVVAKHFGIKMKDTIAIGDSNNDLYMLEISGLGIAMGNATKRAKECADYITTESYNDGIYNAIKKYNFI